MIVISSSHFLVNGVQQNKKMVNTVFGTQLLKLNWRRRLSFYFHPAWMRRINPGKLLNERTVWLPVCLEAFFFLLLQVECQRYRERTHPPSKTKLALDQWGPAKISYHHAWDDFSVLQRFHVRKVGGTVNLGLPSFLPFSPYLETSN